MQSGQTVITKCTEGRERRRKAEPYRSIFMHEDEMGMEDLGVREAPREYKLTAGRKE